MAGLRSAWRELPGLFGDRIELFALEMHRAGLVLLHIVLLGMGLLVLALSAWLGLWALLLMAAMRFGLHVAGALALGLLVHALLAAWLLHRVQRLLPALGLPATRRHLSFTDSPLPPHDDAATGPEGGSATAPASAGRA